VLERGLTPNSRRAQGCRPTPFVDARGRPNGSRSRADCYCSAAPEPRRVWRPRDRRPHHPPFPTRGRERAARSARPPASDACAHADRADGDVPTKPDRPVRVPGLQSLRRRARPARVDARRRGRRSLGSGRPAQRVVRKRDDIPGLLADADQCARAVHFVTGGAALVANYRCQG